jgi:hypothetical protein
MSEALSKIVACAQNISRLVGQCSDADPMLKGTGRRPVLADVDLSDLLAASVYVRLDDSTRRRIEAILQQELRRTRARLEQQHFQLVAQYRSLEHCGLNDIDVEGYLIGMFETRYRGFLNRVREALSKSLARVEPSADNRNTRGGFGDVSPSLHHSKLTSSAHPPNARNSIQLHKVPPLNRDRPLVKIDFTGTSSSTSPLIHSFILHS